MSNSIQIPLNTPHFNLMFLSMESLADTENAVEDTTARAKAYGDSCCKVLRDSAIKTIRLNECGEKLFFDSLSRCNLTEIETAYCQRAHSIFSLTAVRTAGSFFAPFWACHAVAQDLNESLSSIVVDLHQGNIRDYNSENTEIEAFGIPLTAAFLTVKAYPKDQPNRFFLCTEGMSRFGLPELRLPDVPSNLAQDGAYMLRAIAQFLWTKLDHIHPEQPHLELDCDTTMSAVFCEYGNPAFHAAEELTIPFALELCESKYETELVVRHPKGYDDYYDWYLSVTEAIVAHRVAIQRATEESATLQPALAA